MLRSQKTVDEGRKTHFAATRLSAHSSGSGPEHLLRAAGRPRTGSPNATTTTVVVFGDPGSQSSEEASQNVAGRYPQTTDFKGLRSPASGAFRAEGPGGSARVELPTRDSGLTLVWAGRTDQPLVRHDRAWVGTARAVRGRVRSAESGPLVRAKDRMRWASTRSGGRPGRLQRRRRQ
jgi:hypothetical protein